MAESYMYIRSIHGSSPKLGDPFSFFFFLNKEIQTNINLYLD